MPHHRFEVTTLGTGAALPARGRYPSAQLLNVREALYLVDCGEGTQERLRVAGINFMRIGQVFITHMHGDHYLGLMGLISTMHLLGRLAPLGVHGPPELREVIEVQLRASSTRLRFPIRWNVLAHASGTVVHSDERITVTSLALKHRIPCVGFVFREQQADRPLQRDRLHLIPHFKRQAVKKGEDLRFPDGTTIPNAELTLDPPPPRAYAYCSDTAYEPALVPYLAGVDLLYHEATFASDLEQRARETFHATAAQAATIAREAGAGHLLLGHFSSRYKHPGILLREAQAIFPECTLAVDGDTRSVIARTAV
jgi:ribonuclease Z